MLHMFSTPKSKEIAAVRTQSRIIVRAMKDIWSSPRAYETVRSQLRGREVSALTEQELLEIIEAAIREVQNS